MGLEFYKKGVNVLLGPVVGPIGSIAEAGRNWEGVSSPLHSSVHNTSLTEADPVIQFTNDPYLNGGLVYETVVGIQESGVSACTKHFIGNEQETNRNPGRNAQNVTVEAVSSNIDDKTIHELYACKSDAISYMEDIH
jgi:beta-glucosidase